MRGKGRKEGQKRESEKKFFKRKKINNKSFLYITWNPPQNLQRHSRMVSTIGAPGGSVG